MVDRTEFDIRIDIPRAFRKPGQLDRVNIPYLLPLFASIGRSRYLRLQTRSHTFKGPQQRCYNYLY